MTKYLKPFPDSQISSRYGFRSLAGGTFHEGIDYRLAMNTPLPALADGVVVGVSETKKYGKYVAVKADVGGVYRWHACNSVVVSEGSRVWAGQTIARSGMTGFWSTGPHGHLQCTRLLTPNSHINPLSVIGIAAPAAVPVAVDLGASAYYTPREDYDVDISYITDIAQKGNGPVFAYNPATGTKRSLSREEFAVVRAINPNEPVKQVPTASLAKLVGK